MLSFGVVGELSLGELVTARSPRAYHTHVVFQQNTVVTKLLLQLLASKSIFSSGPITATVRRRTWDVAAEPTRVVWTGDPQATKTWTPEAGAAGSWNKDVTL